MKKLKHSAYKVLHLKVFSERTLRRTRFGRFWKSRRANGSMSGTTANFWLALKESKTQEPEGRSERFHPFRTVVQRLVIEWRPLLSLRRRFSRLPSRSTGRRWWIVSSKHFMIWKWRKSNKKSKCTQVGLSSLGGSRGSVQSQFKSTSQKSVDIDRSHQTGLNHFRLWRSEISRTYRSASCLQWKHPKNCWSHMTERLSRV